jgi:hypothetical protein
MWPFSCYGYLNEIPCVPGLIEVSAEELRWQAYAAKAEGTSSAFLQKMEELETRQAGVKQQYINITPEEVANLVCLLHAAFAGYGTLSQQCL